MPPLPLSARVWLYRGGIVLLVGLIGFVTFRAMRSVPGSISPVRMYEDGSCAKETTVFPTPKPSYHPGEPLVLDLYREVDATTTILVSQNFLNILTQEEYPTPSFSITLLATGCRHFVSPRRNIPPDLPPGRYVLRFVDSFESQGRKWVLDGFQTSAFDVVQ